MLFINRSSLTDRFQFSHSFVSLRLFHHHPGIHSFVLRHLWPCFQRESLIHLIVRTAESS